MAITYTRARPDWQDDAAGGTPIMSANLDTIEAGIAALYNLVNAKGDLIVATAADTLERLAAGNDSTMLQADSASAAGVRWAQVTSYTPVWASIGTQPALGNGTAVGEYIKIGKIVLGWFLITLGSTSTAGTDVYEFTLPSNRLMGAGTPDNAVGFGTGRAVVGGAGYACNVGAAVTAAKVRLVMSSATTTGAEVFVSATAPAAPGSGASYGATFTYREA